MFSLTRKQFPNLRLTSEDLDALTDIWLAWHEQAQLYLEPGARLTPIEQAGQDAE